MLHAYVISMSFHRNPPIYPPHSRPRVGGGFSAHFPRKSWWVFILRRPMRQKTPSRRAHAAHMFAAKRYRSKATTLKYLCVCLYREEIRIGFAGYGLQLKVEILIREWLLHVKIWSIFRIYYIWMGWIGLYFLCRIEGSYVKICRQDF